MSSPDTPLLSASPAPTSPDRRLRGLRRARMAAIALVAFGIGGVAVHVADGRRASVVVALTPGPVAALKDGAAGAVKGQVTDVFGNRFVVSDETGKALVDTGRAGEGTPLVTPGETVTVQGRLDRGALHAVVLSHADGRQDALDPGPGAGPGFGPPPPPRGPGWFRAL